jgi:hypothetical protein
MQILTAIAVSALAWIATVGTLVFCLFKEHLPSDEGNMAFYFMLQAAVPVFIFWWMTHRPAGI